MFPGWISTRSGVSWSFLCYGVLNSHHGKGVTGPAHLVPSLGNSLLQTGRKIHVWVSFALPPWLLLGQRLPQPCPEGNGSFPPSGNLPWLSSVTIPLGDHFRCHLGGCGCLSPSAGEGSRCAGVEPVLQPLETAGSAGVDSALPISDPLAQTALGNAAAPSLLLRLDTQSLAADGTWRQGQLGSSRSLFPASYRRVGRPLQKSSPTGGCSPTVGAAGPSSRQRELWAGTGTAASGCGLFPAHSGSGVASRRSWTGNPRSLRARVLGLRNSMSWL